MSNTEILTVNFATLDFFRTPLSTPTKTASTPDVLRLSPLPLNFK
ncbi:MAG: hypothetical protein V7L21_09475 [Nostoc sp.]|nr:hypothetical protein [Nostoc sp. NMS9]